MQTPSAQAKMKIHVGRARGRRVAGSRDEPNHRWLFMAMACNLLPHSSVFNRCAGFGSDLSHVTELGCCWLQACRHRVRGHELGLTLTFTSTVPGGPIGFFYGFVRIGFALSGTTAIGNSQRVMKLELTGKELCSQIARSPCFLKGGVSLPTNW